MQSVELHDGRRVSASYDFARDWWVAQLDEDPARVAEGRWLNRVLMELLDAPSGEKPEWFRDTLHRLAGRDTPLGRRFRCRCCGYLTLRELDMYEICPVCNWEDDPTTIFEPGESAGGPGPNHVSLSEGRHNLAIEGISNPRLKGKVSVRDPLAVERP